MSAYYNAEDVYKALKSLPSITPKEYTDIDDFVEVVRCKDCKHWGGVIFGNKCTMLSGLDYVLATKENDYCSYGAREEGVDDNELQNTL